MVNLENCRVAVLCGGTGSEREVSLVSGRAVAKAACSTGLPVDLLELKEDKLPESLDPQIHLVLPLVHGAYGEDGRLSADLDAGGFAYGGCQQQASEICFDKVATKNKARECSLPVARDLIIDGSTPPSFGEVLDAVGLPFILKPVRDGSSVGLFLVKSEEAYTQALADMLGRPYLAETYHVGYDLTVGVLEGKALEVIGVHTGGGLYDYAHKYTTGMSRYEVPARLDSDRREQLRSWATRIFSACGCRDLARVDFFMADDGDVCFLEVNTLPGMTPTSLLPKSASCCGITFEELVERWIQLAAGRWKGGLS